MNMVLTAVLVTHYAGDNPTPFKVLPFANLNHR